MKFLDRVSLYHLIIIFLLSLSFLGAYSFGAEKVLWQIFPPLLAAIITDSALKYLKINRWMISPSPIITGFIIGLVGQFGESVLNLVVIAVAAMVIKAVIRWNGRHIFNPAASGLFFGLIFSSLPSWWIGGTHTWIFLFWLPILLYKQRRWAPIAGFIVPIVLFNGLTILFSAPLLFFISVMLIEPKTSPLETKTGLLYGLIVAVGYILLNNLYLNGLSGYLDVLVVSLLIGNLGARFLQKILV